MTAEPAPGSSVFATGAATDANYESTGPVYVRLGSPPEFELRAQAVGLLKNDANSRGGALDLRRPAEPRQHHRRHHQQLAPGSFGSARWQPPYRR